MIQRVCTLTENTYGKPRKNNFDNIDHVSEQGDSGFYVWFREARERRHKNLFIAWRHSANLYVVWSRKNKRDVLEADPLNGLRIKPYTAQITHAWRVYSVKGKDNSMPAGQKQFDNHTYRFGEQPPAVIDADHLWTPLDYPSLEIRDIKPTTGLNMGEINLIECLLRDSDEDDRPIELDPEEGGTNSRGIREVVCITTTKNATGVIAK